MYNPKEKQLESDIFSPVDESEHPIKLLFPGQSGTGKTRKACQLTDGSGRVALFNFDGNTSGLLQLDKKDRELIDVINPRLFKGKEYDVKDFWKVFTEQLILVAGSSKHSTIVLDSTTTFVDELYWMLIGKRDPKLKPAGADGKQGFAFWGEIKSHLNHFAQLLLHAPDLDKHIIVIAHDAKTVDETTKSVSTQIIIPGSTQETFPIHFTDVWRTYVKVISGGPVEYRVRTVPDAGVMNRKSLPIPDDFVWDKESANVKKFFKNLSK